MRTICKVIFVVVIGCALGGGASPNIVIQPSLPISVAINPPGNLSTVRLVMDGTEPTPQLNRYEEKSDKVQIGDSESLSVHLSDFWLQEPPQVFIQRVLENDLKTWGYKVVTDKEQIQLHGHLNKFSLISRAINLFEFQADGMIDVELEAIKGNAIPHYKGHYVGMCTYKTATEIPNKVNMEKLFNKCVEEFQKQLESDLKLRAALSAN